MKTQDFKKGEIMIYKTSQNEVELKVHFEKENIWLTQNQIALLFGTQRPAITKHLKNIFYSGELKEKVVSSILEHTTEHGAIKGKTQNVKFYNLDAIISVGIINGLYQTFGKKELYSTVEDKASHLLYLIIKYHPFSDGNKRSAAFLFVYFLDKTNYLFGNCTQDLQHFP